MSAIAHVRAWLARDVNLPVALGVAALAAWPFVTGDPYSLRLLTIAGLYALAAIGYQFVFGHAGALSLAQGMFFGLGAYVAGILSLRAGAPFEATLPAAMLAAGCLAAAVAVPVLRLQSHYFALATLGIAQVVLLLAVNWVTVTGGANGLAGIPALTLFGWTAGRGWPMLALAWTLVLAGALLARQITGGLAGPALALMRDQPMAAEATGIDTGRLRFAMFVLSALYGGAAGALQVHTVRVVSPEVLEFPVMVALLAIAVIGGRASIPGAILGAVLLIHLPEWFRPLEKYYLLAYGGVLMAMIVAAPWGLMGALRRVRRRLFPEAEPPLPTPRAVALRPAAASLEIAGLRRHFGGVRAVDGIDLAIGPGESVGIVGANGSGKTTLVNLIAGAEKPDAGRIRWAGREIGGEAPSRIARAGLARTFQTLKLLDEESVVDNVAAGRWRGWRGADLGVARGEAMTLLGRFDIADAAWRPCGSLPPGLRRRVEIARALIGRPSLMLLDEPAAGLTGPERADLAEALTALRGEGLILAVVEHDLDFLERVADRFVCLDGGRVIADGSAAELRSNPAVVSAWLGGPRPGATPNV